MSDGTRANKAIEIRKRGEAGRAILRSGAIWFAGSEGRKLNKAGSIYESSALG